MPAGLPTVTPASSRHFLGKHAKLRRLQLRPTRRRATTQGLSRAIFLGLLAGLVSRSSGQALGIGELTRDYEFDTILPWKQSRESV